MPASASPGGSRRCGWGSLRRLVRVCATLTSLLGCVLIDLCQQPPHQAQTSDCDGSCGQLAPEFSPAIGDTCRLLGGQGTSLCPTERRHSQSHRKYQHRQMLSEHEVIRGLITCNQSLEPKNRGSTFLVFSPFGSLSASVHFFFRG